MAGIVYEGVRNTTGDGGKLFQGQSFWVSSAVPQHNWLIENAIANGATIVPLEKQADVLIVDHARRNAPVGTHSYRYIEQSIRNGTLEDLADHVVGPAKGTDRPVGSMTTASKGSRSKYTEVEDQLLWNFIKPHENAGGATGGNEIYKQLEEMHGNGRHTYQSWRDRWLKYVRFQNRQVTNTVYTAADDEGLVRATQVPVPSQTRRVPVSTTTLASSPREAVGAAGPQALMPSPTRTKPEPGSLGDAVTLNARKALQRKLGRLLPSSPSPLNARHWKPVPVAQRPQDVARTEAVRVKRQQAGLGTHVPEVESAPEQRTIQRSQTDYDEQDEGIPGQNSQEDVEESEEAEDDIATTSSEVGILDEFLDDDYDLLMNAAGHITRVGDKDDESWEKVADNYPSHSAKSWRAFWEEKVKPDYQKQILQIKKEHASDEEMEIPELESQKPAVQCIEASSSDEEFQPPSQSEEDADDDLEGLLEEDENGEVAEEQEQPEEDGLDSLFNSELSSSSEDASPYACRWPRCDANMLNLYMLIRHVKTAHEPAAKEVEDEGGYICKWTGCRKIKEVGVSDSVHETVLNLQSSRAWVKHYIDEHMRPINRRHGIGLSMAEVQKAKRDKRKRKQRSLSAEEDAFVSTRQRKKPAQLDGASEDDAESEKSFPASRDEVPAKTAKSEVKRGPRRPPELMTDGPGRPRKDGIPTPRNAALEPGSVSLAKNSGDADPGSVQAERAKERVTLSSNEDDNDRDRSASAWRSKRLKNDPRPQHIKDSGFNYVDKAVGSSPPLPAQNTPAKGVNNLSFQPLSPSLSKAPEPNEARKRSASKGNSQESTQSTSNVQEMVNVHAEESEQRSVMSSPRKRSRESELRSTGTDSPELPARAAMASFEPKAKRKKQRHEEDEPLEIPSTPEHRTILGELRDDDDESMLNGSSTPRLRPRDTFDELSLPGTPTRRAGIKVEGIERTSPFNISMFSDHDSKVAASSPARSASTRQDELSSEPDLEFETAPQTTAALWGTAPSEELEEEEIEEYETVPEPKAKERERLDTQSLFAQSIPDIGMDRDDPFALPEPEGGWPDDIDEDMDEVLGGPLTELPIPTSYQPEQGDDDENVEEEYDEDEDDEDEDEDEEEDDDDDDDDAQSISSDVPGWVAARMAEDESIDMELLLRAIQARSGYDEKLIIEVHDFTSAQRARSDPETLPVFMKGCWTDQDDEALTGNDASEKLRILKKHGRKLVQRRTKWLNQEI